MNDENIIAYLLEELPEDDLERFEDECLAQESWPVEIDLAEQELIDSYLRDELIPERRHRFEQNYLTTEARQERVSIAAALLRRLDEYNASSTVIVSQPPLEPTWTRRLRAFWSRQTWVLRAATAVAVLAIAGSLWLFRTPSPRIFAMLTLTISNNNRAEGNQS